MVWSDEFEKKGIWPILLIYMPTWYIATENKNVRHSACQSDNVFYFRDKYLIYKVSRPRPPKKTKPKKHPHFQVFKKPVYEDKFCILFEKNS